MKPSLYIVFLFFVFQIQAQKTTNKFFSSEGVSTINIDGSSVFKITIKTAKTKDISIESFVEGENSEHVVLVTHLQNNQLQVSSVYQPLFVADDDKRSVHKLISIELTILIPEHLNIIITSNIASVFITGSYNQVTTELINGSFQSKNFQGNLLVNTIHGDIHVATNLVTVQASSKHGDVKQEVLTQGSREILLNSINGNITVTKTE